jgi:4a-hydroxytetrahydrobiopterin dehydratase
MSLAEKQCVPCRGGVPPLAGKELENLSSQLSGWTVSSGHHLEKSYKFPDFRAALAFVNRVGEVAEEQGHHPELGLGWGHVDVRIWTHKIDGLTESDFILAAKLDRFLAAAGAP